MASIKSRIVKLELMTEASQSSPMTLVDVANAILKENRINYTIKSSLPKSRQTLQNLAREVD